MNFSLRQSLIAICVVCSVIGAVVQVVQLEPSVAIFAWYLAPYALIVYLWCTNQISEFRTVAFVFVVNLLLALFQLVRQDAFERKEESFGVDIFFGVFVFFWPILCLLTLVFVGFFLDLCDTLVFGKRSDKSRHGESEPE